MHEYTVMLTDGTTGTVSHEHAEMLMREVWGGSHKRKETILNWLQTYMDKAKNNINDVTDQHDRKEITENDIKRELAQYFNDDRIAELLIESVEFMAGRLAKCITEM